jgi:hypothetical protein
MPAKDQLYALVEQAAASGLPLSKLRGIAFYDMDKDAPLTLLNSFAAAEQAFTQIPEFVARFGGDNVRRVALQFVYEYFARVDSVRYEPTVFDPLWEDFTAEIANPQWATRGIANVKYFTSQSLHMDLGEGTVIRGRDFKELYSFGFNQAILDRIADDWIGFGASSFVLVAEDLVLKQPDNIILMNSATVWAKAARAIQACRLAGPGDITLGSMWVVRASLFNFGIGGVHQTGVSIPSMGSQFVWSDAVAAVYPQIHRDLSRLENKGYGAAPGNLDIALRSFMGTYDRWPNRQDSQLLDAITALEALFGTETEIAFKLAFRVAALLSSSDSDRAQMLKLMKDFYDTRSKLVHGAGLRDKHQRCLQQVDELRALVRRLLRAFVAFTANPPGTYGKAFFREQLDLALVDAAEREKLRAALGLNQ